MSPTRRGRTLVLLAAALLLVAALAVGMHRAFDPFLTAGERELVGRWRFQIDGFPAGAFCEYEFLPDRRCRLYNLDPKTGAMREVGVGPMTTWRRSGDTLFVRTPDALVAPVWDILGTRRHQYEVSDLAPDGPGRIRYAVNLKYTRPAQGEASGTMTRVPGGD